MGLQVSLDSLRLSAHPLPPTTDSSLQWGGLGLRWLSYPKAHLCCHLLPMEGQVWLTSGVWWGQASALCFASISYPDRGQMVAKQHVIKRVKCEQKMKEQMWGGGGEGGSGGEEEAEKGSEDYPPRQSLQPRKQCSGPWGHSTNNRAPKTSV